MFNEISINLYFYITFFFILYFSLLIKYKYVTDYLNEKFEI